MNNKIIENFWSGSNRNISHLSYDYVKSAIPNWKKYFLDSIDFNDKIVIDYGIGGGFLGQILLNQHNIKRYIGLDISKRQLIEAKDNLQNDKAEFHLTPVCLKQFNADIFITQSVIQHFPTEEILTKLLEELNESKIQTLILQIRFNDKNKFSNSYETVRDALYSCYTNKDFIDLFLTNYNTISVSDIDSKTKYQNLIYDRII